jgi:hypothetical protein
MSDRREKTLRVRSGSTLRVDFHLRLGFCKCCVYNYLILCDCAFHLRLEKIVISGQWRVVSESLKPSPCNFPRLANAWRAPKNSKAAWRRLRKFKKSRIQLMCAHKSSLQFLFIPQAQISRKSFLVSEKSSKVRLDKRAKLRQ